MKTVELKLSYDKSLFIPLDKFSEFAKMLDQCKLVERSNIQIDGKYTEFFRVSEGPKEMQLREMPTFVTEWPESDYDKEWRLEKEAKAKAEAEAQYARDNPSCAPDDSLEQYLDEVFPQAGSND